MSTKLLLVPFIVLIYLDVNCQERSNASNYIREQILIFKDSSESPLTKADFDRFDSIPYFKIDTNYIVTAHIKLTPDAEPFEMLTSTDRRPVYVTHGILHFELKERHYQLSAYKNMAYLEDEEYFKYMFIPFADETNGLETYGGGRFMELLIPEADSLILDFNQTFNPLCAYNHRYSCPKPPAENHLNVKIEAGVKTGLVFRKN